MANSYASQKDKSILVLGGTGKTGRRVARQLAERGWPVRVGSRSATPSFDWERPETWSSALRDASAAYVSYFPDLAAPGAASIVGAFVERSMHYGVRRLVLLSGRGETEAQACEQMLQSSGADWTILRASWFCQNFSESFLGEGIARGEVALPAGAVAEPFVDADDIADVAVAALTQAGHVGQLYELTGPRLLTFADAVAEVADARGQAIHYAQVSIGEFRSTMAAQGVPDDFISLVTYLFTTVLDGRNSSLADGVQRALGRPPRDFAAFALDAQAAGAWDAADQTARAGVAT